MSESPAVGNAGSSPTRTIEIVRRVAGPIWLRMGISAVLVVQGRRTGTPIRLTVVPVDVEGTWYLLSTYGISDWVRNLRAAGRGELTTKGRTMAFTAIEVDGDERDRVIARFHEKTPRPFRNDFDQLAGADDHPAFRVEPIE